MRASHFFVPGLGATARRIGVSGRVLFLTLLAICASVATVEPMTATAAKPPVYTLSIVEGETTLPESSIVQTSGSVEPKAQVAVSIVRNGTFIAKSNSGEEGDSGISQVPQVGDVVNLESPVGHTIGAVVYDGLPSMDPTVCAGSTNFSGQNTSGETVKGGYFTEVSHQPYSRCK